jgi:hypothetical protein
MPNQFLIITLTILVILPVLVLSGLGCYWLWQHDWLFQAMGIISANVALVYYLWKWKVKHKKHGLSNAIEISANPNWSDDGKKAFDSLKPIIEHWQHEPDILTNFDNILKLTNEVLYNSRETISQ